jgi:hypothetical protein
MMDVGDHDLRHRALVVDHADLSLLCHEVHRTLVHDDLNVLHLSQGLGEDEVVLDLDDLERLEGFETREDHVNRLGTVGRLEDPILVRGDHEDLVEERFGLPEYDLCYDAQVKGHADDHE